MSNDSLNRKTEWAVSSTFVIEFQSASKRSAYAKLRAFKNADSKREYYVMEICNPKPDNSNRYSVCRTVKRYSA